MTGLSVMINTRLKIHAMIRSWQTESSENPRGVFRFRQRKAQPADACLRPQPVQALQASDAVFAPS